MCIYFGYATLRGGGRDPAHVIKALIPFITTHIPRLSPTQEKKEKEIHFQANPWIQISLGTKQKGSSACGLRTVSGIITPTYEKEPYLSVKTQKTDRGKQIYLQRRRDAAPLPKFSTYTLRLSSRQMYDSLLNDF